MFSLLKLLIEMDSLQVALVRGVLQVFFRNIYSVGIIQSMEVLNVYEKCERGVSCRFYQFKIASVVILSSRSSSWLWSWPSRQEAGRDWRISGKSDFCELMSRSIFRGQSVEIYISRTSVILGGIAVSGGFRIAFIFTSFTHLPLGDSTAILFSSPVIVMAMSIFLLKVVSNTNDIWLTLLFECRNAAVYSEYSPLHPWLQVPLKLWTKDSSGRTIYRWPVRNIIPMSHRSYTHYEASAHLWQPWGWLLRLFGLLPLYWSLLYVCPWSCPN